ncbi:N-glycosylase/DNA lyase [Candidatus Pacearchaeota archaeon]|nr:N-glycosylase/DNA lyase [Candidatus Pacearchaeota archaeon]
MKQLIEKIKILQQSSLKDIINNRLREFESFKDKGNDEWFSELCFCLLTANSRAKTAINIQKQLGAKGFLEYNENNLANCIIMNNHRFPNMKAKFIIEARKFSNIKSIINNIINKGNEADAREWLVSNVKGIGYKEASHFLRNTGHKNISILDRHILNLMLENSVIPEKPKSLNKKMYFDIEQKFREIASQLNMNLAELDLYMWYMKTGEVLK